MREERQARYDMGYHIEQDVIWKSEFEPGERAEARDMDMQEGFEAELVIEPPPKEFPIAYAEFPEGGETLQLSEMLFGDTRVRESQMKSLHEGGYGHGCGVDEGEE
jgi:hypothetical protein